MKFNILTTAPFRRFPKVMKHFHEIFDGEVVEYMPYEEILLSIEKFDGMIPNARIALDSAIIDRGSKLKAVYQPSMGYEHIDIGHLKHKSIAFNALGLDVDFKETLWSTAEHTLSLILSLLKDNNRSVKEVKSIGSWDNRKYKINDLRKLNVGVIGYGNVGKKVSYLCNCFGAKISAFDPYLEDRNFEPYVTRITDLKTMLKNSDIVSLHVPYNDETKDLLGEEEVNCLKVGSYLINTSRGGIVKEDSLMKAIESHRLGGVATDVLEGESPYGVIDQPFVKFSKDFENVLITPHLGGSSYPYMETIFLHAIDTLFDMLSSGSKNIEKVNKK
jgi:D-3-phosphoglycerate dehydrogenase / 2-oxoglutarate reductase